MEDQRNANPDNRFFTYFASFWIFLGWLGFILALSGIFYSWIFALYFFLGISFSLRAFFSKNFFLEISQEFKYVGLAVLALAAVLSFFTTPTIFSGRDQGSISEAAIRLSQNHQLAFSTPASAEFFKIYGPGRALNFPGFHYLKSGNLITQFPIPYIAWLGIFYSLFGLSGLVAANAVLFLIFLLSFYLIGKIFLEKRSRLALLLAVLSSFSFSWFLKFTLSENLALALIWFGILQLLLFIKNKEISFFIPAFFAFGLLAFSRIEGIAIFVMFLLALIMNRGCRNFLLARRTGRIYLPLLFLVAIFILALSINFPFFKEAGKALLKNPGLISNNDSPLATMGIFYSYGILQFALFGLLGIAYSLKNKNYSSLIPLFLVFPVFLYLLNPHISQDHPWMLRRFVFAILPTLIFYSVFLLSAALKNKRTSLFSAIIFLLLVLNFPAFGKYFSFSENQSLLAQTGTMSRNFSGADLVLVDRLASGDGFSMITGPLNFLYGKNAAYFFNPADFDKLDSSRFNKAYLVTPDGNIDFYRNSPLGKYLKDPEDYSIIAARLDPAGSFAALPGIKEVAVKGKIFEIKR